MTSFATSTITPDEWQRLFGSPNVSRETGRSRLCKVCSDWHSLDRPWPHNCRQEPPPRADIPTPQIAPAFQPFITGEHDGGTYIGSRADKREYMERNGYVEYDAGVANRPWTEKYDYERDLKADIQRARQEDPINRPPLERVGESDLAISADKTADITTDGIDTV